MTALPLAETQTLPKVIVGGLVLATLVITYFAKRRTKTTGDHYVAGRRIGGWQNGLALAGDQISSAAFLGITGAVALGGFNGFLLAVGIPTAYVLAMLLVAEPLRNLERFTIADAIAARFEGRGLRASVAVATLVMAIVYQMIQFVGAGLIAKALLGVDFAVAVAVMAGLMTLYTVLGGMVATTYIQIFKTGLLIGMTILLYMIVISRTGWHPLGPMLDASKHFGAKVVEPNRADSTMNFNNLSLCLGLGFGIMGLPHVMLRYLTVRDTKAARSSAVVSLWIFAGFFLLLPVFGYAALNEVGKAQILADNPAGNLAATALAQTAGGDVIYALVAGVVIATILAVLAGLAIAASGAVAHDLYTNVLRKGDVDEARQLLVGRVATVVVAAISAVIALGAETINVAFLGNVAFAVAASTTMPVLLLTLYWRDFNRTGATAAIVGGLTVALVLVALGPDVMGKDHIWPLSIPAIVSIPAGFLCAYVGARVGRNRPDAAGVPYEEFAARAFPPSPADMREPERQPVAAG